MKKHTRTPLHALLLLNSDFGMRNTIGARAAPIADVLDNPLIICRSTAPTSHRTITPIPVAKPLMQALSAIPIYITKRIDTNPLKNAIFDIACKRTLLKQDLSDVDLVHSWDPLARTFQWIKKHQPHIKIILDVPMALPNTITTLKSTYWTRQEQRNPAYFTDSLPHVDLFISPSPFVHKSLTREGIPSKKIVTIPFGVNSTKFSPCTRTRTFSVAFSGNINNRKGIPYLLDAWNSLKLDADLHLYGRVYPEVQHLLRGSHRTRVHGFTPHLERELCQHHAYCFPTLLEGSAKSVYEAMASGLAIITTPNAGSVVRDGTDGIIIPAEDTEAIKNALSTLYKDSALCARLGKNARKRAEHYTWKRYAHDIKKAYQTLVRP